MLNLVFLPATAPKDETYGTVPKQMDGFPNVALHEIHYPDLVWYNEKIRAEPIRQIRALKSTPVVLVGFSKSGLGAWNIAAALPKIVSGTIIFDAPVVRENLPEWGTELFYKNNEEWQKDLPVKTISRFKKALPETHTLVLISGESFHDEMLAFSEALSNAGLKHVFLSRPRLKHHWQSGWIEEGIRTFLNH